METLCEVTIEIGGYKQEREERIRKACIVEWAFRETDFFECPTDDGRKQMLQASALGTLYGGEIAAEVVERLERAVWRANENMCHVAVETVDFGKVQTRSLIVSEQEYELQRT